MDRSAKTLPQKTIKKTLALGFPRRLSGQDKPPTSRPAYTQKFVLSRFNYLKSHFFNRLYWGAPLLKVTPASPPPRPHLRISKGDRQSPPISRPPSQGGRFHSGLSPFSPFIHSAGVFSFQIPPRPRPLARAERAREISISRLIFYTLESF